MGTMWNETPNTAASMGSFIRKTSNNMLTSAVRILRAQRSEESCYNSRERDWGRARERESARCINKRNALFISVVSPYSLCSVCRCCCGCLSLSQRLCRRLSGCVFAAAASRDDNYATTTATKPQSESRKWEAKEGINSKADERRLSNIGQWCVSVKKTVQYCNNII